MENIKAYICDAPEGTLVGYGYCNGVCEECQYGKAIYKEGEDEDEDDK